MVPIRTQCRTQALFLDQSTISLSGSISFILYFLYGCTLQRTESDFCENGGGCLEVNDFYPIFHFMNNPPRPLASGRVDAWLCASVPPQPLPVPPTNSHQGEGNPPLPLAFPSLLAPARPAVGASELLYLSRGPSLDTQIEFKTRPRRFKTF